MEGSTKSEEELEMEDISLTLLFISSFPSFQVPESLALPPTPGGGVRNKRKIFFVVAFVPAHSATQRLYQR